VLGHGEVPHVPVRDDTVGLDFGDKLLGGPGVLRKEGIRLHCRDRTDDHHPDK
jgi:hypothetical protein